MKGRQIVLGRIGGFSAAALLVDGRLEDFLLDAPERPRPGAIYRAVCDRPMGGQGGMMVRLPEGTGYLRHGSGLVPGERLLVQVTGYADAGKAVPVSRKLNFRSRLAVITPFAPGWNISRKIKSDTERDRLREVARQVANPDWGLILRSSAADLPPEALSQEIAQLTAEVHEILCQDGDGRLSPGDTPEAVARREWEADIAAGGFEQSDVLEAIDDLRRPVQSLGAGSMSVEPTRAMIAVDIDTGGETSPAAGFKANLAAMAALPRALRLRGLGGQVVIDMAPMPKSRRADVEQALTRALAADPVPTSTVGWTPLGHLELNRKRDRNPVLPRLPEVL